MKLPVDVNDLVKSGGKIREEREQQVRIAVFVEEDAPDELGAETNCSVLRTRSSLTSSIPTRSDRSTRFGCGTGTILPERPCFSHRKAQWASNIAPSPAAGPPTVPRRSSARDRILSSFANKPASRSVTTILRDVVFYEADS